MSSEKARVWVFSIVLVLLILFALVYRPTDGFSHPADQMPAGRMVHINTQ